MVVRVVIQVAERYRSAVIPFPSPRRSQLALLGPVQESAGVAIRQFPIPALPVPLPDWAAARLPLHSRRRMAQRSLRRLAGRCASSLVIPRSRVLGLTPD